MPRICLVGGAGFIGSALAWRLTDDGDNEVLIVDSLMVNNVNAGLDLSPLHQAILKRRREVFEWVEFVQTDARDYEILSDIMRNFKPEVVVHLAAVAHQDRAQRSPRTTWGHSIRTLENALDISAHVGVKRFVYFSSSTVYGEWPQTGAVDENTPCNPLHVYGSLKLAGELTTRCISRAHGFEHQIIRPSALYGPGCISGRVVQRFIENARDGKPLELRKDEVLDFTYIDDLVDGVVRAIQSPICNNTYNLTYGKARLVSEVANLVALRYPGTGVEWLNEPGEFPRRGALSIEKARTDLGYDPQWPLERGLAAYVDSYGELDRAIER